MRKNSNIMKCYYMTLGKNRSAVGRRPENVPALFACGQNHLLPQVAPDSAGGKQLPGLDYFIRVSTAVEPFENLPTVSLNAGQLLLKKMSVNINFIHVREVARH